MVRRGFARATPGFPARLLLIAMIIAVGALPKAARAASPSVTPSHQLKLPTYPWAANENYDPAASYFYSLLSFGAMNVLAPAIFGDFQSTGAVSYTPQWGGIMPQNAGFDPTVSTMLNGIAQQDLLPTGGALIAQEFGVAAGSDADSDPTNAPLASDASDVSFNIPTVTGEVGEPPADSGRAERICAEAEVAGALQAGGEFWNGRLAGIGGAGLAPAVFPLGVATGPVARADPLRGLGPTGDRSNLVGPGPAGGWCRPGRQAFSLSSPLEDDLLWIALSIALGAVIVAVLSRGARLPAI